MRSRFSIPALNPMIEALNEIRAEALAVEQSMAAEVERVDPAHRASAQNLLHYMGLRRHDLRPLQRELAALGLSSLGRTEAHVLATIDAVLSALRRLAGQPMRDEPQAPPPVDFAAGPDLLERHAEALLGPRPRARGTRVMVTMPTEAAANLQLVRSMMDAGMDICRINCAHDDSAAWERMTRNVRQASQELNQPCRILMDLAGPKLRTGQMAACGRVLRCRPTRDFRGAVARPARVWLTPADGPRMPDVEADAVIPIQGDLLDRAEPKSLLRFKDTRGKWRQMQVLAKVGRACWAELEQTAYFECGMAVQLDAGRRHKSAARIADLPMTEEAILLRVGDILVLTGEEMAGANALLAADGTVLEPAHMPCTFPEVFDRVHVRERVFFDDGQIAGVVRRADGTSLAVEITHAKPGGSRLRSDRGINLPDSDLDLPGLTAADLEDLTFAAAHADMVGLSFVRRPEDVERAEQELDARDAAHLGLVLKIETRDAFDRLPRLLLTGLRSPPIGVLVARGDLGVELGFERLAEVQEEILWLSEAAHVPVIWATQVLETLAKTGMPSRAEVTDAAMSGRAECVMLNKGPHIVEAVRFLSNVLERMQAHHEKKRAMLRKLAITKIN